MGNPESAMRLAPTLCLPALLCAAEPPTPSQFLRFTVGADRQLADYSQISAYFKALAEEAGMPYQSLINLYLRDCVQSGRKLDLRWT